MTKHPLSCSFRKVRRLSAVDGILKSGLEHWMRIVGRLERLLNYNRRRKVPVRRIADMPETTMRLMMPIALTLVLLAPAKEAVATEAAIRQLAPGDTLRVAIAVGPAPSALYAVRDAGGKPRGVAVDLGAALAKKDRQAGAIC